MWRSVPIVHISNDMEEGLIHELLFYAEALGIRDSAVIQVRYSLRLPNMKNGLIQYQNTGYGKTPHQIMIWINRRLMPSEQSMTLAHEMVHAAQYIHGKLSVLGKLAIWHNERFLVNRIPHDDRPWEREAHEKAFELRTKFLARESECKIIDPMMVHPYFAEVM